MLDILRTTVGTGGPLVIEHKGRIMTENCTIIAERHIESMIEKLKNLNISKIEQTSDRSFSIS
jgi:propanediol utilization protein